MIGMFDRKDIYRGEIIIRGSTRFIDILLL
jgi:hypothetical protein